MITLEKLHVNGCVGHRNNFRFFSAHYRMNKLHHQKRNYIEFAVV